MRIWFPPVIFAKVESGEYSDGVLEKWQDHFPTTWAGVER